MNDSISGRVEQRGTVDVARLMDEGRFSRRQLVIIIFCGLFLLVEGYDSMQIAYVAPNLIKQWHLAPSTLSLIFSASGISSILGSLVFGPLADRYGRRVMLIGGAVVMGIASLGGAWSNDYMEFFIWRLLGGVGLGLVMPTAIALGAEYAPARIRSFTVTAFYTGYALGASIGAGLSSRIIPVYGWETVLVIGGLVPIGIALLALPFVPESIRFLVLRKPKGPQIPRELRRINPSWQFADDCVFTSSDIPATKTPVRDLFREGRGPMTLLIWVIFFMSILEIFFLSSWIPTILHNAGIPLNISLDVLMVMQAGAIVGGLVSGAGIDRWKTAALVPIHLIGIVAVATFGMVIGSSALTMFIVAFFIGAGVMGAQNGVNGLIAKLFPTAMRATGISSALGIGRFGTIAGPAIGGAMLSLGLPVQTVFLIATIPTLFTTTSIILLWLRGRRPRPPSGVAATGLEHA